MSVNVNGDTARNGDPSNGSGNLGAAGKGVPGKIGPYGIRGEIGRGGMGIVYLGRDSRLDRAVAIKVLSDSFAQDPDRLARFEREARLLASLSHPNIAVIHGLEDDEGRRYLTLEYVEGDTLAERIERGPLSFREAVEVCCQIADALEAAHESGVVHRDLKPSNVKIKSSGEVKVLDFGLAKGILPNPGGDPNASPTISYAPTGTGVILGTAAYMSPEQARGKAVDRRTDIWSFGCVLFECLTGRQAFAGETTSDTIARILVQEPEWGALPGSIPPEVRNLLHRCLEKDPKRRLRDIGDARLILEDALAPGASGAGNGVAATTATATARGRGRLLALATGCLAGTALGFALWTLLSPGVVHRAKTASRYSIVLPSHICFRGSTVTPDGTRFVFTGKPNKLPGGEEPLARVYVRSGDSYDLKAIPGTEGIRGLPVASRDNRSIVFVAPASSEASKLKLYRAPLDGGSPPIALGDWNEAWSGMTELSNGDLLILTDMGKGFVRFPAKGGAVGPRVKIDTGSYTGHFESVGSGAISPRGVLLNGISYGPRGWLISVALLDPVTGIARILVEEGGSACYAPTGHLLFTRGDVLHAAPFDLARLKLTGEPVAILSGVRTLGSFWPGSFQLAGNGTLLYSPGGRVGEQRQLVVIDRNGVAIPLTDERKAYSNVGIVALSRVGGKVAVSATNASGLDEVWVYEPGRTAMRRLVSMPADCNWPMWSPDGRSVAFMRWANNDEDGIYIQGLDGGSPRRIFKPESPGIEYRPFSWSPDGGAMLASRTKDGNSDVWLIPVPPTSGSPGKARPLVATRAQEFQPAWSPDGRSIAYTSDESGKCQIYVAPYRADGSVGSAVPVTRGRGVYPRWVTPTRLVYFDENLEKGMALDLTTSPSISASEPTPVIDHRSQRVSGFAARSDGTLIAMQRSVEEDDASRYHVVLDWLAEVEGKAARR